MVWYFGLIVGREYLLNGIDFDTNMVFLKWGLLCIEFAGIAV